MVKLWGLNLIISEQIIPKDGIKVAGYATFPSPRLRIFASPSACIIFWGGYESLGLRQNFFETSAVYPPRMAPNGSKLWANAFQAIPDVSFFNLEKQISATCFSKNCPRRIKTQVLEEL